MTIQNLTDQVTNIKLQSKLGEVIQVVNIDNYTNCISSIPLGISWSRSGFNVTINSGSKLTKVNGTDYTTTKSFTFNVSDNKNCVGYLRSNNTLKFLAHTAIWAGSTAPTKGASSGYYLWFDTSSNKLKESTNSGSSWIELSILPFIHIDSAGRLSILDRIGVFGCTFFIAPNVELLFPVGRNANGQIKSIKTKTSKILYCHDLDINRQEFLYAFMNKSNNSIAISRWGINPINVVIVDTLPLTCTYSYIRAFVKDENLWYYNGNTSGSSTNWVVDYYLCPIATGYTNSDKQMLNYRLVQPYTELLLDQWYSS